MSQQKAKTLQQRFGFIDDDLKTPLHDDIVMWADENIESILNFLFPGNDSNILERANYLIGEANELIEKKNYRTETKARSIHQKTRCINTVDYDNQTVNIDLQALDINNIAIPPYPNNVYIDDKIWEKPVMSKQYIIGFVDLYITFALPELRLTCLDYDGRRFSFNDDVRSAAFTFGAEYRCWRKLAIEVKTKIPSLGELLRQIRMYQEYMRCKYLVVCPDSRFRKQIEDQGIMFLEYDPKASWLKVF